jgi:hypothetical protein
VVNAAPMMAGEGQSEANVKPPIGRRATFGNDGKSRAEPWDGRGLDEVKVAVANACVAFPHTAGTAACLAE